MMGRQFALAAIAGMLILGGCASSKPADDGWRRLFNGYSLDGWTPKIRGYALGDNYRHTFTARNGVLRVSYDEYDQFGDRYGHLFYKTPFNAYVLRLEYRFVGDPLADTPGWAITNSGVMIFSQAPQTMSVEQEFPVSAEAQLLGRSGDNPRFTGNLCTPGTHVVMGGALVTEHCINGDFPVTPNGEWARFEIEVRPDGAVIQRVNGAESIRYADVQLDPSSPDAQPLIAAAGGDLKLSGGYIALQSEGHPLEFRRIEIKELR